MNPNIPEELITDILWRLPINKPSCVARFRCVCKSWCALLSNPSFILREDPLDSDLQILINFDNENDEPVYSLLSADTLDPLLPSPVSLPFNAENPLEHGGRIITIAGSCNGLICISRDRDGLILWNPATAETKLVPPSPSRPQCLWSLDAVGFGFDSETNDYKVIRQVKDEKGSCKCGYISEVYSLRNDSWTRLADDDDDDDGNGYCPCLPCMQIPQWNKGKLYWWGWDKDAKSLSFDSFDISSQEFEKVDLPIPDSEVPHNHVHEIPDYLLMMEESMVALFPLAASPRAGEIWVLCKYWIAESWTKCSTLNPLPGTIVGTFVGISRNLKWLFTSLWSSDASDDVSLSLTAIEPRTGKFYDLDISGHIEELPVTVNYTPSQVCMRDYFMSS
ncbi:unnamed protein product [Linum trigynum]|uniref:F-box associated beta-propeller type 1 domain-containing protein n=1 Tax=Linum trigynum TaxID=586398 RepID=A0AAV2C938_9ROSI